MTALEIFNLINPYIPLFLEVLAIIAAVAKVFTSINSTLDKPVKQLYGEIKEIKQLYLESCAENRKLIEELEEIKRNTSKVR